jgi:hypothetical protein
MTSRKIAKRPRPINNDEESSKTCQFCQQSSAAVSIQLPRLNPKKQPHPPKSYCLSCYYTTSAIRTDTKHVSVVDQSQLDKQLPQTQLLFSQAFCELQQELAQESTRAFKVQKKDPLAALLSNNNNNTLKKQPKTTRAPKPNNNNNKSASARGDSANGGGFLQNIPLPERLLRTQKQQAQLQAAQIARMNNQATTAAASSNIYQRRKSSKKSIWNMAMEDPQTELADSHIIAQAANMPPCSCGSRDVHSFGNITSRNQDTSKGETWGMKDRGAEIVTRYQCNECGKTWMEEE